LTSGPGIGTVSGGLTTIASTVTTPTFFWTSHPSGIFDPGALQVEFDFFAAEGGHGVASLRIEGIALTDLFQSQKFYGKNITVRAGMQKGLPLANPAQAGVIWNGFINQSWGNWIDTDQTLDFVMFPSQNYTYRNPGNFVLNWPAGTSLQSALTTCLGTAYPTLNSPTFAIGSQYILNYNPLHAVSTFRQLCEYVKSITASISPPGVSMAINPDNSIHVWDGSAPNQPVQVAFTDLIGQPTWIEQNVIQFMTVMRADIHAGTFITLPSGLGSAGTIALTPQSFPSKLGPQYKSTFQGNFLVQSVRYIGNFRDPAGSSWASVIRAVPNLGSANPDGTAPG
jgi:hypothetical protein